MLRSEKMLPSFKIIQNSLINRMMKQGGKMNRLSTTLNNLFGRHFDEFDKNNNASLEFAESLLN